jgi:hypothetical protein
MNTDDTDMTDYCGFISFKETLNKFVPFMVRRPRGVPVVSWSKDLFGVSNYNLSAFISLICVIRVLLRVLAHA